MTDPTHRVAVICGGVGAARFLRGLVDVIDSRAITAIVNVADDMELHGLHISPDIDTVIYTLADEIDPDRGWGLRNETWQAMDTIRRYDEAADWFSLGDRDLATHLHRTGRLHAGATISEVTAEIAEAWNLGVRVLPATDDPLRTKVTLAESGDEVDFQRYFVGHRHDVAISDVRFDGADDARATSPTIDAILQADAVIIAPSNPIVSIAPVLAVNGLSDAISSRTGPTIAISPIVGGAALKGPAARMLSELGHDASALGVARLFSDITDVFVIDDVDAGAAGAIAEAGITPYVTDTIMSDPAAAARLARATLSAAGIRNK
ncbi:MAG: 2-phospho-L-lactate transferase [Acidimicrobiales bacterium]